MKLYIIPGEAPYGSGLWAQYHRICTDECVNLADGFDVSAELKDSQTQNVLRNFLISTFYRFKPGIKRRTAPAAAQEVAG